MKASTVDAPLFQELPMTLECRLVSCDDETGCVVGDIVNISADESILDENGKISPEKFTPLVFDPVHHAYLKVGGIAGHAFQDGLKLK